MPRLCSLCTTQSLSELPRGPGSELIAVKIDSLSDSDAQKAVELIRTKHGIQKLDIVVANAGYGTVYGDMSQVRPGELRDLFDINAVGMWQTVINSLLKIVIWFYISSSRR